MTFFHEHDLTTATREEYKTNQNICFPDCTNRSMDLPDGSLPPTPYSRFVIKNSPRSRYISDGVTRSKHHTAAGDLKIERTGLLATSIQWPSNEYESKLLVPSPLTRFLLQESFGSSGKIQLTPCVSDAEARWIIGHFAVLCHD
jgi:hypothetical protein